MHSQVCKVTPLLSVDDVLLLTLSAGNLQLPLKWFTAQCEMWELELVWQKLVSSKRCLGSPPHSAIKEEITVEPWLLHIKGSQLRRFGHLTRSPPECLLDEVCVLQGGRPRTRCKDLSLSWTKNHSVFPSRRWLGWRRFELLCLEGCLCKQEVTEDEWIDKERLSAWHFKDFLL